MTPDWRAIYKHDLEVSQQLEVLLWKTTKSPEFKSTDRNNLVCALADRSFRNFRAICVLISLMLCDQAFILYRALLESATNCLFLAITDREEDIDDFMSFPGFDFGKNFERISRESPHLIPQEHLPKISAIIADFEQLKLRYRPYKNEWCRLNLRERSKYISEFFHIDELADFVDGHHSETSSYVHSGPLSLLNTVRDSTDKIEINGERTVEDAVIILSVCLNFAFSFAAQLFTLTAKHLLPELQQLRNSWIPADRNGNIA